MLKSELQAALDLCVEALEEVEFVEYPQSNISECQWCNAVQHAYSRIKGEHADDCLRQRALAMAKGECHDNTENGTISVTKGDQ